MEIVFWSPSRDGQTARNMHILANAMRIDYGICVHTFSNYKKACGYRSKRAGTELVFVDCGNSMDACVRNLFKTADTVVINFPEKERVLTDYFLEHHEILGNIFYLISSSPANTMYQMSIFQNYFRLRKEEMGVLPYNARFEECDIQRRGFFYQNSLSDRALFGIEEEFALKTREITVKILKMNCLL